MEIATSELGCGVIGNVLSTSEVAELRKRLLHVFDEMPENEGDVKNHPALGDIRVDVLRYPEIYRPLFTPNVIAAFRQFAADWPDGHFVISLEHGLHRNGFGTWHKDTDAQERAGQNFHWYPGYRLVQCGFYLQEASIGWGGGLAVIPGSHKVPNPFGLLQQPQLRDHWYADKQRSIIPSGPCDMVGFDSKIDHRAAPKQNEGTSPYGDKLAIFISIMPRDQFEPMFSQFLHGRADYESYLARYRVPEELEELGRANNFSFQR
jgi:hypothetical protein